MRIALCDDNAQCRQSVHALAAAYAAQHPHRQLEIAVFAGSEALLAAHRAQPFDIYVLDIVMPGMNGIELGERLRSTGSEARIIYLTSSADYAVDSFRIRAFHYLLKPVEEGRFFAALDEAIQSLSQVRERGLIVKTKDSSQRLLFQSILYATLSRRSILYRLTDGKTLESTSVRVPFPEAVRELLEDRRFYLCGAGMAVNLHHITRVGGEGVEFRGGEQVYLGKRACRELRVAWNEYWLNGEGSQ